MFDPLANRSSGEFPDFEPVETVPNLGEVPISEPSRDENKTGSFIFIAAIGIFVFWFLKKSLTK